MPLALLAFAALVIIADDKAHNLADTMETFTGSGTWVHAWRYTREDAVVSAFDPEEAASQWNELEPALRTQERVLGPDHPDVALTLENLAQILMDRGDLQGAEPLLQRALRTKEDALGREHPYVGETCEIYAELLRRMGRSAEAEEMEARARAIGDGGG